MSDDEVLFFDDIESDEPFDHEAAAAWFAEAKERMDGSIVTFGFRLPNEVADLFEPGDFVGPILEAHYRGLIEQ